MQNSRERILSRIRQAQFQERFIASTMNQGIPVFMGDDSNTLSNCSSTSLADEFIQMAKDYKAQVFRVEKSGIAIQVLKICNELNIFSLVVPTGIDPSWIRLLTIVDTVIDSPELTFEELSHFDAALTSSTMAIASTGTIVLSSKPDEGRRAMSLIPDVHICVVFEEQIAGGVQSVFSNLNHRSPATLISGPSATSDIELIRVEGVHGPRSLQVLVVCEDSK